jgi:hypothetical protein
MITTRSLVAAAAVLALSGLAPAPLWASDMPPAQEAAEDAARTVPGGASKGVKACHEDIERFCAKVEPGDGRLGRCLERNRRKLSSACRRFVLHGGKEHSSKAFLEIDQYAMGLSTAGVTRSSAPAKAP